MIVPNLMVSDMARSVRFYRDTLGMTLIMTVSPEREVGWPGEASGAAFSVLEWDGAQLMLQTVESLAGELAVFAPDHAPAPSGTIYFRGLHPGSVRDRVAAEDVVKGAGEELVWDDGAVRAGSGWVRHLPRGANGP